MHTRTKLRAATAATMLSLFAVSLMAPAAMADHGHRYKGHGGGGYDGASGWRGASNTRYEWHSHSSAGPIIAGVLGGIVLGAAISHAAQSSHTADYTYEDPYCHQRFASVAVYQTHLRHYHHPRVMRVIMVSNGRCVGTQNWRGGRWVDAGGYYSSGGDQCQDRGRGDQCQDRGYRGGRYQDDRGYYDRGYDDDDQGYAPERVYQRDDGYDEDDDYQR